VSTAEQSPVRRALPTLSAASLIAGVLGLAVLHLLEPELAPTIATVSQYANTDHGWLFTASILLWSLGSALLLLVPGTRLGTMARWLVAVWVVTGVVVAFVSTDPDGAVLTTAGSVHSAAAISGITALWLAEVLTAISRSRRWMDVAAAVVVPVAFLAAPIIGFGASERLLLAAHIAWLVSVALAPGVRRP
jgi:hypothetical protein